MTELHFEQVRDWGEIDSLWQLVGGTEMARTADEVRSRTDVTGEVEAMLSVATTLEKLDEDTQIRVLMWAGQRLGHFPPPIIAGGYMVPAPAQGELDEALGRLRTTLREAIHKHEGAAQQ